ncbi:MAG: hypothetical protein L3K18_03360 [Thermoplasmata archaeon]|nr:hypothetical protein [Thermoplasmata archaeon]
MMDRPARLDVSRRRTRNPALPPPRTTPLWTAVLLVVLVLPAVSLGLPANAGHVAAAASARTALGPVGAGADLMNSARASLATGHGRASLVGPAPFHARPSAPAPTPVMSMAYDAADGYILALTPNNSAAAPYWGNHSDSWTYTGGTWTKLSLPVNPPNRGGTAMAYDAKDRCVLLFGGYNLSPGGSYGLPNDTWSFANGTWTNLTPNVTHAPSPREFAEMVWDASDQYVLLLGGFGTGGNNSGNLSDSWTFAGNVWTQVNTSAHPPFEGALAYDSHDGYVVHFGGTTVANYRTSYSNDTWKFHAGTWQNLSSVVQGVPSGRAGPMLSDDPNVGGVLLFGGFAGSTGSSWLFTNDSWSYANQTWTLLSRAAGPSPRYMAQMVFDAEQNATILFGGTNLSSSYGDTWAFGAGGNASSGWSQAAPVLRSSHQVIDAGVSVTFAAGSVFGSGAAQFNYTGLPPGCVSADATSLTCVPTAAGTFTVGMTAIVGGGTSVAHTTLRVNPALQILSLGSAFPTAGIDLTQAAAISLALAGGAGPYAYSYPTLPPGCATSNSSVLVCTPSAAGNFAVVASAADGFGGSATVTGTLPVNPWPAIASFGSSAANVTIGSALTFRATAEGGTGYLIFTYTGLPSGCDGANSSVLTCAPTASGTYGVTLAIRDAVGGHATSASVTLRVNSAARVGPPHTVPGSTPTLFTTSFVLGLLLGLVVLAAVVGMVLRAARENAEGRRIVEELARRGARSAAPDPPDVSPSGDRPGLR